MQKNNDKQESIQLSLFDSFNPEPPVKADPVWEEPEEELIAESVEELVPVEELTAEPVEEEPVEGLMTELIEEPGSAVESVEESEPVVELAKSLDSSEPLELLEPIMPMEPSEPISEHRPLSSTEELLQPMVIYFDPEDIPAEKTKEEQSKAEEPSAFLVDKDSFPEVEIPIKEVETTVEALASEAEPISSTAAPTVPIIPTIPETHNSVENIPSVSPNNTEKLKVLITGASGFIGGFLVREALDRGYEVWAGIRAGSSRARLRDERIRFIDLVYDDEVRLKKQLEDFRQEHGAWDYIIHNAGITKTLDKNEFFRVNAGNTSRFIEALNAADCRPDKFLLMSSLSSYGAGDEKGFTPIRLDDEQRPDTIYGMSKLKAENSVRNQDYFPYIILRPTGVYGPGDVDYFMEIKSIRSGFDFAVGMTPQRITFIYVKDLATVAFLALEKEEVKNRHYFVADGDVYTDHSFARMIQDILSKKRVIRARIPTGLVYVGCLFSETVGKLMQKTMTLNTDKYKILKQRNWICDVTPLQDDLGFVPTYSLREGLEETIAWYIDEGWL